MDRARANQRSNTGVVFKHNTKQSDFNNKSPQNVVTWPQLPQGNTASIEAQFGKDKKLVTVASATGEWALFRLVSKGTTDATGRTVHVTWPAPNAKNATPVVVDFELLDASGAPLLKRGWMGGFTCALQVVP